MPPLNAAAPISHAKLRISEITLKSDAPLKSVEVKIFVDNNLVLQQKRQSPENTQAKFYVSRNLLPFRSALQIKYSYSAINKTINVKGMDLLGACKQGVRKKQVWKRSYGTLELVVELQDVDSSKEVHETPQSIKDQWLPITDNILAVCPQFRVLVIGKPGAGKSALINEVFGVASMTGSHNHVLAEEVGIDHEIQSESNPYFVLHNSPWLKPDDDSTVQDIQNFLNRHSQLPDIKDRIHAIWVFVEIPITCVPLMEPSLEKLLTGMSGQFPVIVVFTKFDRLVDMERFAMIKAGLEKPSFKMTRQHANSRFTTECIFPFQGCVGKSMPYLAVSIYDQYQTTLHDLIELTSKSVEQYVPEAAVVLGISQKVSAHIKIHMCIKLGVENYWGALEAVHHEIVKAWNFDDKLDLLYSPEFKALLNSVPMPKGSNLDYILAWYMSMLKALKTIVPSHRHINPQQIFHTLNLTLVLQNLFWIETRLAMQPRDSGIEAKTTTKHRRDHIRKPVPITRHLINLAFKIYQDANYKNELLAQADRYAKKTKTFVRSGTEATKIIQLVHSLSGEKDVTYHLGFGKFYRSYKSSVPKEDEPWILPAHPRSSPAPDARTVEPEPPLKVVEHRFRILIIGRANAGKTTILNKICYTTDDPVVYDNNKKRVDTSSIEPSAYRGLHNIENEIAFKSHPSFVFHDSLGFEAGAADETNKVWAFISERAKAKDAKIDVIWYCIPMDDNRPITYNEKRYFSEVGTGNVPIVAVFTKSEALEMKAIEILEDEGYDYDEAIERAPKYVEENLKGVVHREFEKMKYPPRGHVYLKELDKPYTNCQELLECTANVLGYNSLADLNNAVQRESSETAPEP